MYEFLRGPDGLAPVTQLETFLPSVRPVRTVTTGVDEAAAARTGETAEAMRYLAKTIMVKLKTIITNNALYSQKDDQIPTYPLLRALLRAHGHGLPFLFCKMDAKVMETLKVEKPVPPPLEVINVDDAAADRVGHVTTIPADIDDLSISFGASSLSGSKRGTKRNQAMTTGDTSAPTMRPSKERRDASAGAAAPGSSASGAAGTTPTSTVVKKGDVIDIIDVQPAITLQMDAPTKEAYDVLVEALQRYVTVYTASFQQMKALTDQGDSPSIAENIDLIMTDPPFNSRRLADLQNSEYDVLTRANQRSFTDLCDEALVRGGHGIIFSEFMQFPNWYKDLCGITEIVDEGDRVNPFIIEKVQRNVFSKERAPLKFIRARGNYNCDPRIKN